MYLRLQVLATDIAVRGARASIFSACASLPLIIAAVAWLAPAQICAAPQSPHSAADGVTCLDCHVKYGGLSGVLEGTAGGGSTLDLEDASAQWEVDEWAGGVVSFVSGVNKGQYREIVSNTATVLSWEHPLATPAGDGDAYQLGKTTEHDVATQCKGCHNPTGMAPTMDKVAVHEVSSGATVVGCGKCHDAHNLGENTGRGAGLVRKNLRWPTVSQDLALPSGNAENDYIQNAEPYAGVCEICHTETAFHRNSADGNHVHLADYSCVTCHNHSGGFARPDCGSCHGYPPVDTDSLVWAPPGPTGSTVAGSHATHATEQGYLCGSCHNGAAGSGPTHASGQVSLGFSLFEGAMTGGSYDGQAAVTYESTEPGTTITNNGSTTCSNVYCHGQLADGTVWGGGADVTPEWGGTVNCLSCHGGAGLTTGLAANHGTHTDADTYVFDCERCHSDTVEGSQTIKDRTVHADGVKDVAFAGNGEHDAGTGTCSSTDCHSDGTGGAPNTPVSWGDDGPLGCVGCHDGRTHDATEIGTNGHARLVGSDWVREYPCQFCHAATTDVAGEIVDYAKHVNGAVDVVMPEEWSIPGSPDPSYDPETGVCSNVYCHSDGTTVTPNVRDFAWDEGRTSCNSCHGHPTGACEECHDDGRTGWAAGEEWKAAMPMYPNGGPGSDLANTHERHLATDFTCDDCHALTIENGSCTDCHVDAIPGGSMDELNHINADYHVNHTKDVQFLEGGSYDPVTKTCSNTACHTGSAPTWGDSVNDAVVCFSCHGTTEDDVDDFAIFNGTRGLVNMLEWTDTGHGRSAEAGNYASGNPPAAFPGNPCWYCHDNTVVHNVPANPFRLQMHHQFESRFERECVYCHMEGKDEECLSCHEDDESLAPQLETIPGPPDHAAYADGEESCTTVCHDSDATQHKSGAGLWTPAEKDDVKNQYMQMGVCLKCHEDDSNDQCQQCHTGEQYELGFDPGSGRVAAVSKATSTHFGFKHFEQYEATGKWKGGKFCWDCHDPHGDTNLYQIQDMVATETDGIFGAPTARAEVSFTRRMTGLDYVRTSPPYDGLCNVCHTEMGQHYRYDYGDGHMAGRVCTTCHEHRFGDSHASGKACDSCHQNKPIPRHTAFSQPRDCTKCHKGVVGERMDIIGQFQSNSHHVQGPDVTNKHCYACHWEATADGLLDVEYHGGYNPVEHETTPDAAVDLVIWGPGERPETYEEGVTATVFRADQIGTANERENVTAVTLHCLGCHDDANNDVWPFNVVDPENGDCKTPRQYAWDGTSIGARYSQTGTTTWGKYSTVSGAAKKNMQKAFSAHGNAPANAGGWSATTGEDGALVNTRAGSEAVQCFDCHSSHGSKTQGVTSGYVTFNGTRNGGNLKETQAGKGGYFVTYKAAGKTDGVNPYEAGAAQCFDCHETENAGATPWGYASTYGATAPIVGYRDGSYFGEGPRGVTSRYAYKADKAVIGGHFKASSPLENTPMMTIDGLCSPCHDPHGVSPSLKEKQAYAVPLLKGTWLTSPYKEDAPMSVVRTKNNVTTPNVYLDQNTFGGSATIVEDEELFGGLCLSCHPKDDLTDGVAKNQSWRSLDRVHESVKGWGGNTKHNFPCSKCHQAHNSGLPRLLRTNGLDINHRGRVESGGAAGSGSRGSYPRGRNYRMQNCHPTPEGWPNNLWNGVTPW